MKKIKKILKWTSIVILVLFVGIGIALKIIVTKEFIAGQIEDNINGRVEIKDISVPLWAAFSGITIEGFKIGYKDAEMGKPMEERTPMQNEVIGFKEFVFKVALGKLIVSFGSEFELKSLLLIQPKAHVVMYEGGGNNIMNVLTKQIKADETDEVEILAESETEMEEELSDSAPFSIKSMDTIIAMDKVGIINGYFTVELEETGNTILVSNVNFLLEDIYIDPQHLGEPGKNQAILNSSLKVELETNVNTKGKSVDSFEMSSNINGKITPFNPATGEITQQANIHLVVHKGSYASGLAFAEKLKSQTKELEKIGVDLGFIKDKMILANNSSVDIFYSSGKITFTSPLLMVTDEITFNINEGSWLNMNSMKHDFTGYFILDKEESAKVEKQIDAVVTPAFNKSTARLPSSIRSSVLKNFNSDNLVQLMIGPAKNKDGGLEFHFISKGSLSSPTVKITKPKFPSIQKVVKTEMDRLRKEASGIIDEKVDQVKEELKEETQKQTDAAKEEAKKE
ncbi:MAG: hypothetical protein ABUK01_16585, partial [Leptospirales bacterium]